MNASLRDELQSSIATTPHKGAKVLSRIHKWGTRLDCRWERSGKNVGAWRSSSGRRHRRHLLKNHFERLLWSLCMRGNHFLFILTQVRKWVTRNGYCAEGNEAQK